MRPSQIVAARRVVLICMMLLVGMNACQGTPGTDQPADREFAVLDDFIADSDVPRPAGPVVVIGIDGASWNFIDPLIERGMLPNLERLKREGVYADLRSLPCYFSPPAWVSMFTGYLPEQTGIRTFGRFDRESRSFLSVNSEDVQVASVWDVASFADRKVAVVNVPMTYPTREVNGIAISGLMTPIDLQRLDAYPSTNQHGRIPINEAITSYSPIRRYALDDSLNSFFWSLYDTENDGVQRYDLVSMQLETKVPGRSGESEDNLYVFEVDEYSPWMRMQAERGNGPEDAWCKIKIMSNDRGGFRMTSSAVFFAIDPAYVYPTELDEELAERFGFYLPTKFQQTDIVPHLAEVSSEYASYLLDRDDWDLFACVFTQSDNIHHLTGFSEVAAQVYGTIDRFIGEVMEKLPAGGTLMVTSDHGFTEYSYGIDLNQLLEENGLLERDDSGVVDLEETLVFHNLWHLYFNRDILSRDRIVEHGIDVPVGGDPADALAAHLSQLVARFVSPDGGAECSLKLERLDDPEGPDMFVQGASGDFFVDFWNLDNPSGRVIRDLEDGARWEHRRDGLFVAWGDGVREGVALDGTDIQNVAPTILYLMGLPIAHDMVGRTITGALEPRYLARHDRYFVTDYAELLLTRTPSVTDREDLGKKLRSLGYIR